MRVISSILFITLAIIATILCVSSSLVAAENKGTATDTWADTPTTTNMWQIISSGDLDELKKILEANPEYASVRASDGRGPLWWAHEYGKKEMIDELVKAGASEAERDADGKSPKEITAVGPTAFQQEQQANQQQQEGAPLASGMDDDDDDDV